MSDGNRPLVVVGVDGSDSSKEAVRWAAHQSVLTGARMRAVSSWRWPNYITRIPPGADLAGDVAQTLTETLSDVREHFPDLEISEHVINGPPGPSLLSQSAGASLLVVGDRGRAAFPGMLLGSVAEYCVRHSSCPVVVVRTTITT
ncbi:MAG: universal stress protein [Jatrophihabitans sp.]